MDRAIDVYKKSFAKQLGFAAIFGIISYFFFMFVGVLLLLVIGMFVSYSNIAIFSPINETAGYGGDSALGIILLAIAVIMPFYFLWLSISSAGHILISKPAFCGFKENLPIGQLPRIACRIFGALIAQALASVPFFGLVIIGFETGFLSYLLYNAPWVFALLTLLFIVVYLLYINIFSLAVAVAVFEHNTFFNALIRSWELIRGEFWKVVGMRLLWLLIIIAIWATIYGAMASVGLVAALIFTVLELNVPPGLIGLATVMASLVSFAVSFATAPLNGVFQATLYFNQRIKKEGLDIEVKLEKLYYTPVETKGY